jgi:hypothetical protein
MPLLSRINRLGRIQLLQAYRPETRSMEALGRTPLLRGVEIAGRGLIALQADANDRLRLSPDRGYLNG